MDHTSGSPIDMAGGVNLTMGSAAAFNTDVTPRAFISLPIGPIVATRSAPAVGGATPHGPFGLPFNGPFAGAFG